MTRLTSGWNILKRIQEMSEKLAIFGGKAVVPEGLERPSFPSEVDSGQICSWPIITEEDIKAVTDVLKRGIIWGFHAPEVSELEKEWAEYNGVRYCAATNSGTSALHMAVAASGVEPGDEVITPSLSFLASATCILHHNAIPVFVDIDPVTFNIDPDKIEKKITRKTKAIMVVHLHGLCCDMDKINQIAQKHNLIVIEDAAQAHGAEYKGKKAGTIASMGAFSLQESKNLTCGEGGLFITDDEDIFEKAIMVGRFGELVKRGIKRTYKASTLGWNYRIHEMAAALARSQLRRLDEYNARRRQNSEYLTEGLKAIKGLIPPYVPEGRTHIYHKYRVRLSPEELGLNIEPGIFRDRIQQALLAEGVSVGPWQSIPVPEQKIFQEKKGYGKGCPWSCPHAADIEYNPEDYPETLKLLDSSFVIHSILPTNGIELMKYIVEAFKKVFANIEKLF